MFDPAWNDVYRTAGKGDDAFGALPGAVGVAVAQGDVELAVEHEEELVCVLVHVPNVLALHLGDPDVVVVHAGDDAWAPQGVEAGQCGVQLDGFGVHQVMMVVACGDWEC